MANADPDFDWDREVPVTTSKPSGSKGGPVSGPSSARPGDRKYTYKIFYDIFVIHRKLHSASPVNPKHYTIIMVFSEGFP